MDCGGQVEFSHEAEVISGAMRPFGTKYDRGEKPPERAVFLGKIFKPDDRGQGSKEDPQDETSKTRNQAQEQDQQPEKSPNHIDHEGPCPKVIRILHKATPNSPTTSKNQIRMCTSHTTPTKATLTPTNHVYIQRNQQSTLSKDDLPSKKTLSRWAKLSPTEREQKTK